MVGVINFMPWVMITTDLLDLYITSLMVGCSCEAILTTVYIYIYIYSNKTHAN